MESEKQSPKVKRPSKDPLHGVTLEMILNELVNHFGWAEFSKHINLNCFNNNPSVKSSLKFLRKTPWARSKVERLYIQYVREKSQGFIRSTKSH